jgi:uncharacterized membrane protein YdbT with pleckstrin-like domain
METAEFVEKQTKQCPFCAETIMAAAIKCRYCNEFLNTDKARNLLSGQTNDAEPAEPELFFESRPSLWNLFGSFVRASLILLIAVFCIVYPIENLFGDDVTAEQAAKIFQYRLLAGFGLAVLVVLRFLMKIILLKSILYRITTDRIEYSRGIFDRKIDNTDMFRVIDLKMRRSFWDCITGVGSVTLETTDKSDPQFAFKKVKNPRRLYDVIKKASLEADQRRSVVHLE